MAISERLEVCPARSFLVAIVTAAALVGCRGGDADPVLTHLAEARRLAGELRVQFNQVVDASNRAVMADTDEVSRSFARDATQATQLVQDRLASTQAHLQSLKYPNELRLLEAFARQFADYRTLDRTILELAVENTNLKAQALLFGPGRKAAEDFRASLETLDPAAARTGRCRVEALVATAISRVRQIEVLLAPHIAEANDAAMTGLENAMTAEQSSVDGELRALSSLLPAKAQATIADATVTLERFKEIARQIVALSRRNTNVRSLALALRDGPPLSQACDGSLAALQDALAKEGGTATR